MKHSPLRATILGSSTSLGVPVIGCSCLTCTSPDPRDKRTRPSCYLDVGGKRLLIDVATDFYHQALRERIVRVDTILFTHAHADHTHGLDDVRILNLYKGGPILCHGNKHTMDIITQRFEYAFKGFSEGGPPPLLQSKVMEGPFEFEGVSIIPVPIKHGSWTINGYRIGRFAYVTDAKRVPEESYSLLEGLDTLVLSALRLEAPHPTHMLLEDALEVIERLRPRQTYLTHMTHDFLHARESEVLPPGVALAYDGLKFEVG